MKKFLKNEFGNAVIIIILLIPTIIGITFTFSYNKMFTTSHEKRIINIVNNSLYYGSEKYGNISQDKNGVIYCSFSEIDVFGKELAEGEIVKSNTFTPTANECFYNDFLEVFKRIDGYNQDRWYFEMKILSNTNNNIETEKPVLNSYVEIKLHIEIPKKYNIDHFGTITASGKTGWYLEQEPVYNVLTDNDFVVFDITKMGSAI